MELNLNPEVLNAYGFNENYININQIGTGLINRTYLVSDNRSSKKYILQNINTAVFEHPGAIASNIKSVGAYLHKHHPDYLFNKPIAAENGEDMVIYNNEYWRLLPFIENAVSLTVLTEPKQAYEAAKQFAKLSRLLHTFNSGVLQPTIYGFHDLTLRYEQFLQSLENTSAQLKTEAEFQIQDAIRHHYILDYYSSYLHRDDFPNRVMHHDTKISNVLLDAKTFEGICVIDLDTVMPGKFISDLGDMMRTYLCAFSENEKDLSKIKIRIPYFEALVKGYLSEMKPVLTETEKEFILFSGKYMIYMQAIRFLTDFLNGNIYYPISYQNQNLDRAKNQFKLLQEISAHDKVLQDIINENL